MQAITLTADQENALAAFTQFLCDPADPVFVLKGYSGTGKTTFVRELLDRLPDLVKTLKLLNPKMKEYEVELTATTNKAAETFGFVTGHECKTIHSFLGLRVQTDYRTNETKLIPKPQDPIEGKLLFIDEASYIDRQLLEWVFRLTKNCKIVFMGDPAQLTPVKSTGTPVFDAKFPGAMLSQVVRQAEGNPIVELSTKFRETVTTGEFFSFTPDGSHIQYLDREAFNQALVREFTRPDWRYLDSKILGWTNKCVIGYNHAIRDHLTGDPQFQVGDYAICNKYVSSGKVSIKTDQLVQITSVSEDTQEHGVDGNYFTVDYRVTMFGPKRLADKNAFIKQMRAEERFELVEQAENHWIDLRAAYACTINKAQGSTYDRVFIDLDDVRRCNSGDQIARMLYVGVSRARHQVFFTGDLV